MMQDVPSPDHTDELVVAVSAVSEFEANTKAIVLRDAGIDAWVMPGDRGWSGVAGNMMTTKGVPVWVRSHDLDKARQALESQIADSVDIDWEEVDVGEMSDEDQSGIDRRAVIIGLFAIIGVLLALLLLFRIFG